MDKIHLAFFTTLGSSVGQLTNRNGAITKGEVLFAAWSAREPVRLLLQVAPTLKVCREAAIGLLNSMDALEHFWRTTPPPTPDGQTQWNNPVTFADSEFQAVFNQARMFETILAAELETLPTYQVGQKGIYDTSLLIETAERVLPLSVLEKMTTAVVTELRAAGQCLAFDVPTAAAFHVIRATESVLHSYWVALTQPHQTTPVAIPSLENWGAYIAELHKFAEGNKSSSPPRKPDPAVKEVVALLQQFKDRHRNLIMHPEIVLTNDEADTLFQVSQGAILAMCDRLPIPTQDAALATVD